MPENIKTAADLITGDVILTHSYDDGRHIYDWAIIVDDRAVYARGEFDDTKDVDCFIPIGAHCSDDDLNFPGLTEIIAITREAKGFNQAASMLEDGNDDAFLFLSDDLKAAIANKKRNMTAAKQYLDWLKTTSVLAYRNNIRKGVESMDYNNRITSETSIDGYSDISLRPGMSVNDAVCRLADYEATGLSPDEIKELLNKN